LSVVAAGVDDVTTTSARPRTSARLRHSEAIAGYLFILPDALGLFIFIGIPMVLSLALGLFEVDGFGSYRFIGMANYARLGRDPHFLHSLKITAIYVLALVPSLYIYGLGLALLIQKSTRWNEFFRAVYFTPQLISLVVVALVWQLLLLDKIGLVNRVIVSLGLPGIAWLGDPNWALASLVVISLWFLSGFYMLIFLGGLQDIPAEYYEAAKIDGARPVQAFFYITLPLLKPTSFFVILVSTVTAVCGFQPFDLVYVITGGGPANATALTSFYIYKAAFEFGDYGYAAAMSTVLVASLLLLTVVLFKLTHAGRFGHE
jgi:multiple sugar transport system permease protein